MKPQWRVEQPISDIYNSGLAWTSGYIFPERRRATEPPYKLDTAQWTPWYDLIIHLDPGQLAPWQRKTWRSCVEFPRSDPATPVFHKQQWLCGPNNQQRQPDPHRGALDRMKDWPQSYRRRSEERNRRGRRRIPAVMPRTSFLRGYLISQTIEAPDNWSP